jgi:hypothetical protein
MSPGGATQIPGQQTRFQFVGQNRHQPDFTLTKVAGEDRILCF